MWTITTVLNCLGWPAWRACRIWACYMLWTVWWMSNGEQVWAFMTTDSGCRDTHIFWHTSQQESSLRTWFHSQISLELAAEVGFLETPEVFLQGRSGKMSPTGWTLSKITSGHFCITFIYSIWQSHFKCGIIKTQFQSFYNLLVFDKSYTVIIIMLL